MIDALQRLFSRRSSTVSDTQLMEEWALNRGDPSKRDRRGQGCVVSFDVEGGPARMEWGPSQRPYIKSKELRIRIDLGLPPALEMLILSRPLAQWLESDAYQQLVRGQQTGIDSGLPEEQRWLSVFEPVTLNDGPELVGRRFVLLGSSEGHLKRWVEGDLANRLVRATSRWLAADAPLVVMVMRGRVYLRTAAPVIDVAMLDGVRGLAEMAAMRAISCQKRPRKSAADANPAKAASVAAMAASAAAVAAATSNDGMISDPIESYDDGIPSDMMTLPMVEEFAATDYPSNFPTDFSLDPIETDVRIG